jgi:hypothetical protein
MKSKKASVPLGRVKMRGQDNIKMNLRKTVYGDVEWLQMGFRAG